MGEKTMKKPEAVKAWEYQQWLEKKREEEAERERVRQARQVKKIERLGGQDEDVVRRILKNKEKKDA